MSTPLERVGLAFLGEPDRVPVFPILGGALRRLVGMTWRDVLTKVIPDFMAEIEIQAQKIFGFDLLLAGIDLTVEATAFGVELIYPPDSHPYPAGLVNREKLLIKKVEDYEKIEPINSDPRKAPRTRDVVKICEKLVEVGKEIPVVALLTGHFSTLMMMRSTESLCKDMVKNPRPVRKALEIITDFYIDYAKALCDTGIISICFENISCAREVLGSNLWIEFECEHIKKVMDEVREQGVVPGLHNCAHGPYFDLMIRHLEPAYISYQYLPDDCKNLSEMKAKYGKETCLVGQIDTRNLLVKKPEEIKEEAKEQIKILGQDGKYILAPGCEFPPNASFLNLKAMMDAVHEYGKYPNLG